jgi:hypothetical protein
MMKTSTAYFDLLERKKFKGPLDIRVPEDHLATNHEREADEPIWSPAIGKALEELNSAVRSGIESEAKNAARGVVEATSAYYRMSGVPTFAHDPVPWQLIKHALPSDQMKPGPQSQYAIGRFVNLFDDSVKPMLNEQVKRYLEGGAARRMSPPSAESGGSEYFKTFDLSDRRDLLEELDAAGDAFRRPIHEMRISSGDEDESGPSSALRFEERNRNGGQSQSFGLRPGEEASLQKMGGTSVAQSSSRSPFGPPWPDEGGESGASPDSPGTMGSARPKQKPSPNSPSPSPTPKPPAPPPRAPQRGYHPGQWKQHPDPRTARGSKLVDHSALSQKQQDNLRNRNWVHPTGENPGHDRLMRGWGYFGAEREEGGRVHFHGGFDAPGNDVVLPTRAKFQGYNPATRIFTFNLEDGLILQIVHVDATPQMRNMRPGAILDAGTPLGRVEGQQDHAHLQLRASSANGDALVVDPTPFMEKRARTFWRRPMDDNLENLIDIFVADSY